MAAKKKKQELVSRLNYTAYIRIGADRYVIESQCSNMLERYTLLKEDSATELSIDDIEIEVDDSLDDLFADMSELTLDEEDSINRVEQNDSEANRIWRAKYVDSDKSKKLNYDLEIDELDELDDTELQDEYSEAIQDGDIKIVQPDEEALDKKYYCNNRTVLFDYHMYAPKVLNEKIEAYDDNGVALFDKNGLPVMKANPYKTVVKNKYGNEDLYEDLSILLNRVFNFQKTSKNFRSDNFRVVDGMSCSAKVYVEDDVAFTSISSMENGKQIGYEFTDKKTDTEIKIEVHQGKKPGKEVCGAVWKLPYYKEYLTSNRAASLKLFKHNTHNRTVVFPDPASIVKAEGLRLGFMDDPDLDYRVVDTVNALIDVTERELMKADVIAYDAETFGLNSFRWVKKPHLVCTHSFSWADKQAIIVPVRMKYCKNVRVEEANEILKPVLETKKILAHNGAADARFLMPDNIILNLVEDTMHLIRVIIPFMVKASVAMGLRRSLDALLGKMFGWDKLDLDKYAFAPAGVDFDFSLLPYSYLKWYGCPDTDLLRRLWKVLRPKLNPEQEHSYRQIVTYSRDMAITSSYSGIGVNIEGMKATRAAANEIIALIKALIYEFTEESEKTLPLTSSKKLANYIYNKLGVPASKGKRTDKGALAADKHVMAALAAETNPNPISFFKKDITNEEGKVLLSAKDLNASKYPFCMLHRTLADLIKDVTAFYNRIINNTIEGVYYEFYKIAQTDTYRDAGAIQITKKKVKEYLGVYNSNYGFCSMDYNTEEFRITVNRSTDIKLIQMLQDPESDAHTMVAAEMYDLPPSEIDKHLRDPIKACNFGIIYGMKVLRLTKNLKKTEHPTEEDVAEVQVIYDKYLYKRAEMLAPLEVARDHVRKYGWVENDLGYRMIYSQVIDVEDFINQVFDIDNNKPPVPHLDPSKARERMGEIMNRAGNYPIQSLAAAQLKDATIRFFDEIRNAGLLDYIFIPLSVHDEIGVIYDKRVVDPYWLFATIHKCFYSEMEYLGKPKEEICPLYIGVGFGTTWSNAKNDMAEFPVGFQNVILEEYKREETPKLTVDDDHAEHFSQRIREYMLNRITDYFHEMIEQKEFRRNEMRYLINKSVFLGKKMHELFKTNDKVEDPVTHKEKLVLNIDKYIALILEHNNLNPEDYTVIDGPVIKDEEKAKSEIVEFFYEPQPHPLVKKEGDYLTVDARGLHTPTVKELAQYLRSLNNPERNYHNKQVRFLLTNVDYRNLEGVKILGVPFDFKDKIDEILSTGKSSTVGRKLKTLKRPPILYDCEGRYIIFDIPVIKAIGGNMIKDIAKLIGSYAAPETESSYQVLYKGQGEDDYKFTNIYMNGIPVDLPDKVKQLTINNGFTYSM